MKTVRRISVVSLAAVALAACSGSSDGGNEVPSSWIRQEYRGGGVGYVDRSDTPSEVGDEIHGHKSSQDRVSDDGRVFLRYRDDIVAITPFQGGSRIEVDDYRRGYTRWRPHIGSVWPDPDSDAFRGGGPGAGK
ncbi:DUF4247 domain-containing protein [Streptomyces sp. NPDC050704]|uniref:DUF4247 domain-containing protein n=1 Tax=Streptomyces sp. NPDC050704 TaxID=3157219 RepID=UPI00341455AD